MGINSTVLVAGDMVLDYHIYEGQRHSFSDKVDLGVHIVAEVGGAGLIFQVLNQLASDSESMRTICAKQIPNTEEQIPYLNSSQHSYALWKSFPRSVSEKQYWRVGDAMGFGAYRPSKETLDFPDAELPAQADVIVISDGGMDYRKSDDWKKLPLDSAKWIVLKTSAPICEGDLWDALSQKYHEKLVLLLSIADLRKTNARISQGLSWDLTLRDILREIRLGGELVQLKNCRHLIVDFGGEAGLWIDMENSSSESSEMAASFVFDPKVGEGESYRSIDGTAFGQLSCLAAAIAKELCSESINLEDACNRGLSAIKNLVSEGHGSASEIGEGFPAKRLAKIINNHLDAYSRARFKLNNQEISDCWSLLQESQQPLTEESGGSLCDEPLFDLAHLAASRGPIAFGNLPNLKIGKLTSVDPDEIESLRMLLRQMQHYDDYDSGKKPLSIGVFGPPGSGKSFAVKEMAKQISGDEGWLEFNLSQFASPKDLIGAFHQIRDKVLRRILPIAFFDEFDSQQLRWLQYLLAPMQDGHFQEGQITHPIGKCIFVFAGGTSWTFDTFGPAPDSDQAEFRRVKGPDFKSRLDGFLNVIGPNQRKILEPDPKNPGAYQVQDIDPSDICFPIRRALMIRAELGLKPTEKLTLDPAVLKALLHATEFENGSRSLSKLLQPFKEARGKQLYKSLLPPRSVIAMHTDAETFLQNCSDKTTYSMPKTGSGDTPLTSIEGITEEDVPSLAEAIHLTYENLGKVEGWLKDGEEQPFSELSKDLQESNFAAARRMVHHLRVIGLKIIKSQGKAHSHEQEWASSKIEYHLELLAEAEHEGWMQWHFSRGWKFAPIKKKDEAAKLHPCLIHYAVLPQFQKEKDRNQIRHYLDFVDLAEAKVMPIDSL